jgi:hypothetical protein
MEPKYGMYEKLINHLRESDEKSFKNLFRVDPESININVDDLGPRYKREKTYFICPLNKSLPTR